MKFHAICLLFLLFACNALGVTRYVDINNGSPSSPYTSWATAATNIQQAANIMADGDTLIVGDGVYEHNYTDNPRFPNENPSLYVYNIGYFTNSNIIVKSLNGPEYTTIKGRLHGVNDFSDISETNLFGTNSVRGFQFSIGTNNYVEGFTFSNCVAGIGYASSFNGAAIGFYWGTSLRDAKGVSNCVIVNCAAGNDYMISARKYETLDSITVRDCYVGPGDYLTFGQNVGDQMIIKNCTIENNKNTNYLFQVSQTLDNCTIRNNILVYNSVLAGSIRNSRILNNYSIGGPGPSPFSTEAGFILVQGSFTPPYEFNGFFENNIVISNVIRGGSPQQSCDNNIFKYNHQIISYATYDSFCMAPTNKNNLIVNNYISSLGSNTRTTKYVNCTIAYNYPGYHLYTNITGGAAVLTNKTYYENCILWSNSFSGGNGFKYWNPDAYTTTNDPSFVDPDNGDFHLKSKVGTWDEWLNGWVVYDDHSIAIDAGDPISDFTQEPFYNGGVINLGVYGNTPKASKSLGGPAKHGIVAGWQTNLIENKTITIFTVIPKKNK